MNRKFVSSTTQSITLLIAATRTGIAPSPHGQLSPTPLRGSNPKDMQEDDTCVRGAGTSLDEHLEAVAAQLRGRDFSDADVQRAARVAANETRRSRPGPRQPISRGSCNRTSQLCAESRRVGWNTLLLRWLCRVVGWCCGGKTKKMGDHPFSRWHLTPVRRGTL